MQYYYYSALVACDRGSVLVWRRYDTGVESWCPWMRVVLLLWRHSI